MTKLSSSDGRTRIPELSKGGRLTPGCAFRQFRNSSRRPNSCDTFTAMTGNDWEAQYQAGEMRWEKGAPSPGLVDFLQAHPELPRPAEVCVPGCGTGHDVRQWARTGFVAHGVDIAPSAIRLCQDKSAGEPLRVTYQLGDFLTLAPPRQFDWLFEHTLFCALPPPCRDTYVQAVRRWLKPNGQFLAVQYMLREDDEDAPPYGVSQEELMERFLPHFELLQGWVPRSYPNRTGLELMLWWRCKP